eukprot:3204376-Pyramimonas_sp.AAC.1
MHPSTAITLRQGHSRSAPGAEAEQLKYLVLVTAQAPSPSRGCVCAGRWYAGGPSSDRPGR